MSSRTFHCVVWLVSGTCLAVEGEHVVLTEGEKVDIAHDDHVFVVFLEHCATHDLLHGFVIALGEELQRFGHAKWRLQQTFPVRIFPDGLNERPHCAGHCPHGLRFRCSLLLFRLSYVAGTCRGRRILGHVPDKRDDF